MASDMDESNSGYLLNLVEKYRVLLEEREKADQAVDDANIRVEELRNEKIILLKEIRELTDKTSINVKIEKVLYEIRPESGESVYISETPIDIEE